MKKKYLNFVDDASNIPTQDAPIDNSAAVNSQAIPQNLTTAATAQPDIWSKLGSLIGGILGTNKQASAMPVYRPVVTAPVNKPATSSSILIPIVVIGALAIGGYMVYKKYEKK